MNILSKRTIIYAGIGGNGSSTLGSDHPDSHPGRQPNSNLRMSGKQAKSLIARLSACFCFIFLGALSTFGQTPYQKPPKEVLDVLRAPEIPHASVNPSGDYMLVMQNVRNPPISKISQPMLRLAGLRINPRTNGRHLVSYYIDFSLKRITDGTERKISLPPDPQLSAPVWSADGKRFAFTNAASNMIELWIGDTESGRTRKVNGVTLNSAYGEPITWMPDNRSLLIQTVPDGRGGPPPEVAVPIGPDIQETDGKGAPVATFEDMLNNPHDEDLFDYYATAQLAILDTTSGNVTHFGTPGIFLDASPSPDGRFFLIARLHRPYSYLYPHTDFPKDLEVWDRAAKRVYTLANLPLEDHTPIEGVPVGPRDYQWRPQGGRPDGGARLAWVEALDGGNTLKPAPLRDRVMTLSAPFTGQPEKLIETEQRFAAMEWGEKTGLVLVSDYNRKRRWRRTFIFNADNSSEAPREIWGHNQSDKYGDPGTIMTRELAGRQEAIIQDGDNIYLEGQGASPEGERPFLDRFNIATLKSERIFRCDNKSYESVISLLGDDGNNFLTLRESPTDPPNYYIRTVESGLSATGTEGRPTSQQAITSFPDPTPQIRGIRKELVTYNRPDGVHLSFTLYLPPGYKQGTRLPTVVWAYPLEFTDAATASQVTGSAKHFATFFGPSELFFLLEGYTVLDSVAMPVVGDPDTVNNTYIEQIVADAKAAIDKAVEMGVTDPSRVGVGGHSYGAFMTANLLAHSDLFRAGIARSGAYNRTLTPFGFQSERRTFWEATDTYLKMSPFVYADKIKAPKLLTHGEADNNTGTFPIQTDRMYEAIRGNGGIVRMVKLPSEAHGYSARESVEHVLYEMISWFDKYVKNAPPEAKAK
jgi:dipeptidyl aminopeptidase/acylaminoacyl peptidase